MSVSLQLNACSRSNYNYELESGEKKALATDLRPQEEQTPVASLLILYAADAFGILN